MRIFLYIFLTFLFFLNVKAEDYTESSFVGIWSGVIESQTWGYSSKTTLELNSDGTYYDESGYLMPSIYPNTQTWDYDAETNRLHFRYLKLVYAGQKSYTNFYFDVIELSDTYMELHYNFWNDPVAQPEVQKLVLSMGETSVEDNKTENENRKLIRISDITGKEVTEKFNGIPLIFQYNNGTIEKKILK